MPSHVHAPVISVPLVHREATTPMPAPPIRVGPPRVILLATTGDAACASAARVAAALAERHGAAVRVISVFIPRIGYPSARDEASPPAILPSDQPLADAQLDAVRLQVASVAPPTAEWPVELVAGQVGPRVAHAASASGADLVVIGNGRTCVSDRALGDRGAIAIATTIDTPLLAVSPELHGTPRRVMFAIGLDACSLRAVQEAVAMLPEPEYVLLAHARLHPPGTTPDSPDEDANVVAARIAEVRSSLAPWRSTKVDVVMLAGDPLQRLLALVRRREVDLVVGGLHGASYDERAHSRNLTLRLLAEAECSVLLLPIPTPAPSDDAAAPNTGGGAR